MGGVRAGRVGGGRRSEGCKIGRGGQIGGLEDIDGDGDIMVDVGGLESLIVVVSSLWRD